MRSYLSPHPKQCINNNSNNNNTILTILQFTIASFNTIADRMTESISSPLSSPLPPTSSPPQSPSPVPVPRTRKRKRRTRDTSNVPRHYLSRIEKLEHIHTLIRSLGWTFTDLLNEYNEQKDDPKYRSFWLQYKRYKNPVDRGTFQKIMRDNGVDEAAHFFRRELDKLVKTKSFGQYVEPDPADPDQVTPDGSLDFVEDMRPDAIECAPYSIRFLGLLSKPARKRDDINPIPSQSILVWVSMFLYSIRREKCNNIPRLFGLYCVNGGVKKRIVDVLSSIGLCASYSTLQECLKGLADVGQNRLLVLAKDPTMNLAHDNFDFPDKPSGERLGDRKTFVSLTNGIIFKGHYMHQGDLKQSSWHPERLLSASQLLEKLARNSSPSKASGSHIANPRKALTDDRPNCTMHGSR